ncbi:protein jagged-1b-like [Acanthaster planci]|uniref:Delta-like protein n=1 Tax=Acanthaster planci TaxID=133434 RepID=A0A8B7ZC32_ACAPL|nr:protein jagged-1b-like [Acanthaster planci]
MVGFRRRSLFLLVGLVAGLLLAFNQVQLCQASGYMEVGILSIDNDSGELANGDCCDGPRLPGEDRDCLDSCDTFFVGCLRQYQTRATLEGPCTFGSAETPVLGNNSFRILSDVDGSGADSSNGATMIFPFEFGWVQTFTLIISALDKDDQECIGSSCLIERAFHSGIIAPSLSWTTLRHNGANARFLYRIRVLCDPNYYDSTCVKFCRSRDDTFGHYSCDANGDKVCHEGWTGENCQTAICKQGCDSIHGYCNQPGECLCQYGWQGELCDHCSPYPGCVHGSCSSPWQCTCQQEWGGMLCDEDFNYCGRHKPCLNDGVCTNSGPNEFTCQCQPGFHGETCEEAEHPCENRPCGNGGTCLEIGEGFHCICTRGWKGDTCQQNIDDCISQPCQNGGECIDGVNSFSCLCTPQWEGPVCQFDANECMGRPCMHAFACRNRVGDYLCDCQPGWTGKNCDVNVNDCVGHCINGGTCLDLVNSFSCVCLPGFSSIECEINIDECASSPCKHGGQCIDKVAGYQCKCAPGFSGTDCQIDVDLCDPNPCHHDSQCFNLLGDYYCACPDGYQGKNCSQPKQLCHGPHCQVVDSCTVVLPASDSEGGISVVPSRICGPHGTCLSQGADRFSCICDPGYTGIYCHENINDCESDPCQNDGVCVDGLDLFSCICPDGWEGTLCQHNVDDCALSPCRNNGTCIDMHADFACQCPQGWKGKTCNSRDNQCDVNTCLNGGTCYDLEHSFTCICPSGWEGNSCQLSTSNRCAANRCHNGATCIPNGDSFICVCREGFEGQLCEKNTDDCSRNPCFNGGRCVDGINWFLCQCADGFTGPDCRINLNECASNPCAYGSTCIDGIGSFTCTCPPGRSGATCSEVIGVVPTCVVDRRVYSQGETWKEDCNTCHCEQGLVQCSKVWCGPRTCVAREGNETSSQPACNLDESCELLDDSDCLTPPCRPWGLCLPGSEGPTDASAPGKDRDSVCQWDGTGKQPPRSCAAFTLTFQTSKLPAGVSVEHICRHLRQIAGLQAHFRQHAVRLMCSAGATIDKPDYYDVYVSLWVDTPGGSGLAEEIVDALIEHLGQPSTSSSITVAITTVNRHTKGGPEEPSKQGPGVIWLLGCLTGIVLVVLVGGILLWARFHYITKPDVEQPQPAALSQSNTLNQPAAGSSAQDLPANLKAVPNSNRRDNRARAKEVQVNEDPQVTAALVKQDADSDTDHPVKQWAQKDQARIVMDIYKAETQEAQRNRLEMHERTKKNASHVELTVC